MENDFLGTVDRDHPRFLATSGAAVKLDGVEHRLKATIHRASAQSLREGLNTCSQDALVGKESRISPPQGWVLFESGPHTELNFYYSRREQSINMGLPETIPTTYVITASALLTGYIAYQSRKNGLETEFDREQRINARLAGSTFPSDMWGMTCDHVIIIEDSGWWYRFRKFFTGKISGEAAVSVRYENATIPGEIWENSNFGEVLEVLDYEWEHVETNETLDPTYAKFILQTVEWGEIVDFFHTVIKAEEYGRQQMTEGQT